MTTKDVNKLDILDKVKEILNKKKMKSKRTSEVYIVDFASFYIEIYKREVNVNFRN